MSQAAVHRPPARLDASVVPDATPAPFPASIQPCHPMLREKAPSGVRWIPKSSSTATGPKRVHAVDDGLGNIFSATEPTRAVRESGAALRARFLEPTKPFTLHNPFLLTRELQPKKV